MRRYSCALSACAPTERWARNDVQFDFTTNKTRSIQLDGCAVVRFHLIGNMPPVVLRSAAERACITVLTCNEVFQEMILLSISKTHYTIPILFFASQLGKITVLHLQGSHFR